MIHEGFVFPLSFAQQRLWFIEQLEPGTGVYNIPVAYRLRGPLNLKALERSLNGIVRRHEVLRTTFAVSHDEPVQIIATDLKIKAQFVDLGHLPGAALEAEAARFISQESRKPFDLSQGPLLRASVLRVAEEEHILVVVLHHIISDGWSLAVLFRELAALYEAFLQERPSPLPDLPIQYADFAVWQREWLQGAILQTQLSYWKKQLDNVTTLQLPTDRPRPAVQSYRGARQSLLLPKDLSEKLKALSRKEGVTLFMTLLAAYQTLLHRLTGQDDIVVGSPIAGRNRSEIEGLIGFFVNTLVLRSNLFRGATFLELLRQVREVCLAAYEHQDLPFEKLVEELEPERDLSRNPLFQTMFVFQQDTTFNLELWGLTVTALKLDRGTSKFDLTLHLVEGTEELSGVLVYNTDLFDGARISRMLEYFQNLLEAVIADPERPLHELPLLEPAPAARPAEPSRKNELNLYDSSNLTQNQLLIWAGQKLQPEAPLYNMPYTFAITGEVDHAHFQKALQTLVNSSDALRTVIRETDAVPQQSVKPEFPYHLEYLDFSKHSNSAAAFEEWLQTRCRISFDFEERLFDCALAKIADEKFIWYLNLHHIIADGSSVALIFRWVSELYGRSVERRLEEKIELPPFREYVDYEGEYRRSQRYVKAETYWKEKLANTFEPISFYGKNVLKSRNEIRRISRELGRERTQKLKRLALRDEIAAITENASMFNLFAALLFTYLYRISGNRRLSIGTPVHNRRSKDFKATLGLLMEVLPLRPAIGQNETFLSLINKIKLEAFEVFRHCHNLRNSAQNKFYDVLLNYYTTSFPSFGGMPVQTVRLTTGYENDSLALQVHDFNQSESIVVDFDFHCDVFNESQSRQAVDHFLKILDALLEDPSQPLERPTLLTTQEQRQILVGFNQTQASFPETHALPRLFEAQAQRTPDHLAIVCEGQSLTYAQLNSKANQLAHYLKSLGVGTETLVAICAEPSLEAIVGILGTLKAGGAYFPLDPQYPRERLAFMLEDAQAAVLLTHKKLSGQYPDLTEIVQPNGKTRWQGLRVFYLDEDWPRIAAESKHNPLAPITADNLAYVMYTSGSTGSAKGVMVTHRGVCNRLLWEQRFYHFDETDRALQKSSFAFDTSVLEIFRPLLVGAQLFVALPADRHDTLRLVELIAEHEITVAEFVPSLLWLLLEENGIENRRSLKYVFAGGEALTVELQKTFFARTSSALYNTYGPTETSIDVTHWKCESDSTQSIVPIGRPIANTQIYILDRHLNPVPIGLPGELHIGGASLARGYFDRPELTAARFIPDPFSSEPGARLYKTGDAARYLPDGNMSFVGRVDDQVKIRGIRIEPGEIEAALRQHPDVRDVAVLARQDQPDDKFDNVKSKTCTELSRSIDPSGASGPKSADKRLVAYVVLRQFVDSAHRELRDFLRQKLPDYMIPSVFLFLDSLPLTPNGKVDRRALLAPGQSHLASEESFTAPRNRLEEMLSVIWAEVLGLDRVSIHENFFDIGGHSLKAMQLASRISTAVNSDISVKILFTYPTISSLAEAISGPDPSRHCFGAAEAPGRSVPSAPAAADSSRQHSMFTSIERRPLLSLFAAGKIEPVDAAALSYFPDEILERSSLTRDEVIHDWCDELPMLNTIMETSLGRMAVIVLPRFRNELCSDPDDLVSVILEALEIAARIGARAVSFTGLIPWATDDGRAVEAVMSGRKDLPMIAKGHATTTAAVGLTIKRMLQEGGRDLAYEDVALLGRSSIGVTALCLMLKCAPHPKSIMICDVYGRPDGMEKVRDEIINQLGFKGSVQLFESPGKIPREIYNASLIVGATNAPDLLDIGSVNPGTMIIDISAFHCFRLHDALRRFKADEDILFSEGGALQLPSPIRQIKYLPWHMEERLKPAPVEVLTNRNPSQIGSCALSSLLSARFDDLRPMADVIDDSACEMHYKLLSQLECQAADLHWEDYVLPSQSIHNFRKRFGCL